MRKLKCLSKSTRLSRGGFQAGGGGYFPPDTCDSQYGISKQAEEPWGNGHIHNACWKECFPSEDIDFENLYCEV